VVDAAYAVEKFITGALSCDLQVVSKLRKDANLRYLYDGPQKARGAKRKYDGKVDLSDVSRLIWVKELAVLHRPRPKPRRNSGLIWIEISN